MKGGTCHGRNLLRREEDPPLRGAAKKAHPPAQPDILTQSAAVQAALNAFNRELIAAHLHSCVARDLREGKDEVIDELVLTLQKLMK